MFFRSTAFSPKRRHFHRLAVRRTVGLWLAAAGGAGNFRFLRNSEARITDSYRQCAAEMGYSMDQILTIASLIQREGSNPDEVAKPR
ncbi:hypothetical protein DWY99_10245 [[Clostridium] leptum]|uniref:Uncharacterized protein n=1 Tax=[Clostridium] leptum TaxID=1535 RepID=A0A412AVR4_9FIRM|nr:hypothetical protein DWY99_10245 [[Clostridium] leptum]